VPTARPNPSPTATSSPGRPLGRGGSTTTTTTTTTTTARCPRGPRSPSGPSTRPHTGLHHAVQQATDACGVQAQAKGRGGGARGQGTAGVGLVGELGGGGAGPIPAPSAAPTATAAATLGTMPSGPAPLHANTATAARLLRGFTARRQVLACTLGVLRGVCVFGGQVRRCAWGGVVKVGVKGQRPASLTQPLTRN
jgi:hypothetical protein